MTTISELAKQRILILDGAMGTMIQRHKLGEADYRGTRFANHPKDLKGDNDLLVLTKPEIIRGIHAAYLDAGADIIETNTFNGTSLVQADYGLESIIYELNVKAAEIAKEAAHDAQKRDGRPRFVAGALGPHGKDAVALAEGRRRVVPRGHVRRSERRVRRAGARPPRRERGRAPRRDDLRHAELEGRARSRSKRSSRSAGRGSPS